MHYFASPRVLVLTGLLFILQYSLSPLPIFWTGRPDLLYLLILDYAFFFKWQEAPFFAFGIGLLRDFMGGHFFGVETASLTAVTLLLGIGIQKLERDNSWVRLGMTCLFVLLVETLAVTMGAWFEHSEVSTFRLLPMIFWTTFYTALISPGFFWLTDRWFRRTHFLKQYELF